MSVRVDENGRQLSLWSSREEALQMVALQLQGRWTARLHEAGRGWLLSDGKSHRYDQGGSLDDADITYRDECPVALVERELSRDGDHVTVKITFDNATGVRARVDSHLTRRGEREFAVTLFSPALRTSATIEEARDLAYSLLAVADEAEKLISETWPA